MLKLIVSFDIIVHIASDKMQKPIITKLSCFFPSAWSKNHTGVYLRKAPRYIYETEHVPFFITVDMCKNNIKLSFILNIAYRVKHPFLPANEHRHFYKYCLCPSDNKLVKFRQIFSRGFKSDFGAKMNFYRLKRCSLHALRECIKPNLAFFKKFTDSHLVRIKMRSSDNFGHAGL